MPHTLSGCLLETFWGLRALHVVSLGLRSLEKAHLVFSEDGKCLPKASKRRGYEGTEGVKDLRGLGARCPSYANVGPGL